MIDVGDIDRRIQAKTAAIDAKLTSHGVGKKNESNADVFYFIRKDGNVGGPFSLRQIAGMRMVGFLTGIDEMSCDKETWTRLGLVGDIDVDESAPCNEGTFYVRRGGVVTGPFGRRQIVEMRDSRSLSMLDEISGDSVLWARLGQLRDIPVNMAPVAEVPFKGMTVWFITGLFSDEDQCKDAELENLRKAFPGVKIEYRGWDGGSKMGIAFAGLGALCVGNFLGAIGASLFKVVKTWKKAVGNADETADKFAGELLAMDDSSREKIILVGHSLGGRIVARILARLSERGMKVRQAFLLAPAIDDDDKDVGAMASASVNNVYVCCRPHDFALRFYYIAQGGKNPLGTNGLLMNTPANVMELCMIADDGHFDGKSTLLAVVSHASKSYIQFLSEFTMKRTVANARDLVPQDQWNARIWTAGGRVFWKNIEAAGEWTLQRNRIFRQFRLLHGTTRKAWGWNEARLRQSFHKVTTRDEHDVAYESGE